MRLFTYPEFIKTIWRQFHTELTGGLVPLPELSFELSIGEVIIILIVIALILLVITIERTEATGKKKMYYASQSWATKECPARFGFLQRLPRGGTIPEECYVCPQLIECLGFQRTSSI